MECDPCAWCKQRIEMYAEIPVRGDWYCRGFVIRIGCVCDGAMKIPDKGWRTEFETYAEAIRSWNEMQRL
jgi:hypothetical protein